MTLSQDDKDSLVKYALQCKEHGLAQDQTLRFISANYFPHMKQMEFHAACRLCDTGRVRYVLCGGSRAGGKSYCAISQSCIDDAQRYDGIKILFLRKVQRAAHESFLDLTRKALKYCKVEIKNKTLLFPNGSQMLFGGFRNSADIEKYIGIEYDLIVIEELTQLTFDIFQKLDGSLRTGRTDGYIPRMYLTTNPGSIGHQWVKDMFVNPYRNHAEKDTRFVPFNYTANPYIDANYGNYLDSLSGELRKAWRDGDWDLNEGCAFAFDYSKHVVKSWDTDETWIGIRGIDDGYAAPYCCLWALYQPITGRVYVYREDYQTKLTNKIQAERIMMKTSEEENKHIVATYCDPAMFGRKNNEEVTSAYEVYNQCGIVLQKGNNDRINGKRKIDNLLANKPDGKPGIIINESCINLIDQLTNMIYDEKRIEDVGTRQADHAYDALRYLLTRVHDRLGRFVQNELSKNRNNYAVYSEIFK